MTLLCRLGLHRWHTRLFGIPGSAFEVRNCARYCGKKPEYRHNGQWIEYDIPREKYQPTITPERLRGNGA